MKFPGFSLPDGAYIPPELIYLIPHISGGSLKVLFIILHNNLQVGGNESLSLTDLEKLTGLSRKQVIRILNELLEEEIIERQAVGQSYVYVPTLRAGSDFQSTRRLMSLARTEMSPVGTEMSPVESESERELIINLNQNNKLSDSSDSTTNNDKITLLKKLRACGVYLKTAQAIVADNTPEEIEQQLKYYRYALEKNLAQGPGWLVLALKEKWPAPLGYQAEPDDELKRKRYAKWNNR